MAHDIVLLMASWGLALVFANVLLEQLGLPLPAMPTLAVAGGLAAHGHLSPASVLGVALLACLAGDSLWFWAGRRLGRRVMKLLCRISLSPDSCVRTSSVRLQRRGAALLTVAKFVPGLSTVAPPLAGAGGVSWPAFLCFDALGALLWAGTALALGYAFAEQIEWLLGVTGRVGTVLAVLVAAALLAYIALKWWRRVRLLRALRMARVDVDELGTMLASPQPPLVLDVRSQATRQMDDRVIPGARLVDLQRLDEALADVPPETALVIYCACPNEVSAARAARQLSDRGFRRVHPLRGGVEAWAAAGHAVERLERPAAGLVDAPA